MRFNTILVVTVLGAAACWAGHQVVLTGQVLNSGAPLPDAWVRLRGPGLDSLGYLEIPPDARTDSLGRFHLSRRLRGGCYAAEILAVGTDPVEWHFWVSTPDSFDVGSITLRSSPLMTGEGTNHLILECGDRDTLPLMYSWQYDTVRLKQPTK